MTRCRKAQLSPAQWKAALQDSIGSLSAVGVEVRKKLQGVSLDAHLKAVVPAAKKQLIQRGIPAAQVNAMPAEQVFLLHTHRETVKTYHDFFKWMLVPYDLGRARLAEAGKAFQTKRAGGDSSLIAAVLLPALDSVIDTQVSLDRRVALLANLQAIRMHAAANNKALPKSLVDVQVVPILSDPATGKAFRYRLEGKKAYLEAPAIEIAGRRKAAREFVITIK